MSSSQKEQLSSETQSREAPPLVGGEDVSMKQDTNTDGINSKEKLCGI